MRQVFVDDSGYHLICQEKDDCLLLEGFGPRGGERGTARVPRSELSLLQSSISETLNSSLPESCQPGFESYGSGQFRILTVRTVIDYPQIWIFLKGPQGGYRRPLQVSSRQLLTQLEQYLSALS